MLDVSSAFPHVESRPMPSRTRRFRPHIDILESREVPAVFSVAGGDTGGLIGAIDSANAAGGSDTIQLAAGSTYTFDSPDGEWRRGTTASSAVIPGRTKLPVWFCPAAVSAWAGASLTSTAR